jgi:hypothetical protein
MIDASNADNADTFNNTGSGEDANTGKELDAGASSIDTCQQQCIVQQDVRCVALGRKISDNLGRTSY